MLEIAYEGRYQCRLATDPDAFADPRGVDGWTFAFPGEPDLDRIIRFANPVAPRSHTPAIGVTVRVVKIGGIAVAAHPWLGQSVDLPGNPVFEGRNGQIATAGHEPVVPFTLAINAVGSRLAAFDPIVLAVPSERTRRGGKHLTTNSPEVIQATGVADPFAYRASRLALVNADLAAATDPTERQALQQRIAQLADDPAGPDIRVTSLGFRVEYDFTLRGPNVWEDPNGFLGPAPSASAVWRTNFWLGGWDADALCGYMRGVLSVA